MGTLFVTPPPEKSRVQPSAGKTLMTVFWDQRREVIVDILAKGSIITGTYYALLLKQLRKSIKTERRGILTRGGLTPAGQLSS